MTDEEGREGGPAAKGPSRPPDPLGRRAFFWLPVEEEGVGGGRRAAGPDPMGKRALYSSAVAPEGSAEVERLLVDRGPITVTCSVCGAVSRIGILDFLIYQLPFGFWLPRGQFDHRMTCPSCRRRVWAGVTVRRP